MKDLFKYTLPVLPWIIITILFAWLITNDSRLENKIESLEVKREQKLPEAFGGVGYISKVGEDYIDVVGYGRFLITPDESQFLQVGDKAPAYILERGQ
ncbi:hypothetical protein [Streptococcus halotolerans]|uniref:hypothetical protein n=1 Tax=Streptococcus halotolerans TaxID=1814128 RepID=UPI00078904DA|nr:hypothetical protein [Streptococcus halotolerans]